MTCLFVYSVRLLHRGVTLGTADFAGADGVCERGQDGGAEAAAAKSADSVFALARHLLARGAQTAPRLPHRRRGGWFPPP